MASHAAACRALAGQAHLLEIQDRKRPRKLMSAQAPVRGDRCLLSAYLRPQGRRVWLLGVLLAGRTGLQLAAPWILRAFIDGALSGATWDARRVLGVAARGVAVAPHLGSGAQS